MLFLHEVHTVAGRHEDEFEDAGPHRLDARARQRRRRPAPLLPEARARHRPRVPSRHDHRVCATAPRTNGSRRASSAATCASGRPTSTGCATRSRASCCFPSTGHRLQRRRPRVRADRRPRARARAVHGRQRVAVRGASSTTYLEAARTHYAPSLEQQTARSLLTLLGVFQAALGAPRRREVVLWQRVDYPERLPGLFTTELPGAREGPGHVDARRARGPRRLGEPPPAQRDWSPLG